MAGEYGYIGKILRVDLSSGSITHMPTRNYADRFLGGRGIAAKIYWDEVSPDVKAFDPESRLLFFTGPLTAVPPVGSRWTACGKSPATEKFCYSSLGGSWGAQLKLAGYDGIVIQGKSEKPVYVFIQDDVAEIRDASALWGKGSVEVRETLKGVLGSQVRVVATGPAGENMVTFASLLADNDASGSGGLGAVMGSKKLKAIAVRGSGKVTAANPEKLRELTKYIRELKKGMTVIGTTAADIEASLHLTTTGVSPKAPDITNRIKEDVCYACMGGCQRVTFKAKDGKKGKFMCGASVFYQPWLLMHYGEWNEVSFLANRLCDEYGLDIFAVHTMIRWLGRCNKRGILTDENTGIPLSKIGSLEFIETLVKKISLRDGFGDTLAQGTTRAADLVGRESGARQLITGFIADELGHPTYASPAMYITTGLLHAMEPRQAQGMVELTRILVKWAEWANKVEGSYLSSDVARAIAKRFWGNELAVDFSTYEGKALTAKRIQDREYVKECLILCGYLFPIFDVKLSEDHVGDPTVESKLLSAVTGKEVDEEGLYRIGERVFNLQRAILAREGHRGRESDKLPEFYYTTPLRGESEFHSPECLAPGKDGEVISRLGEVFDRERFEGMKDEYYQLRGWDVATGLQTKAKLEELGLRDVAEGLAQRGLIV